MLKPLASLISKRNNLCARFTSEVCITENIRSWFPSLCFTVAMFSELSAQKEGSSLLCRPASEDQVAVFERVSPAYSPCECYGVGERSFSRQYAHIYAARLMQMRPLLTERAQHKWGETRIPVFHYFKLKCFLFIYHKFVFISQDQMYL